MALLEEARIHPRVAHDQRIVVEQTLLRHRGCNDLFGRICDVEEVNAGLVEDVDRSLHGRIAVGTSMTGTPASSRAETIACTSSLVDWSPSRCEPSRNDVSVVRCRTPG
jgi:hypothetical protein